KRQLSARCFFLNPNKCEKEELEILLNDPMFLVRVIAARAIIKLSDKKLFESAIRKMAEETPLSRYSYRDALINADNEKFQWLEELASTEKNSEICSICLDLLSTRTTTNQFPIAKKFIYTGSKECKFNSIQILKKLPGKETVDLLTHSLSDNDWEIRAEGAKALASLQMVETAPQLEPLLSDKVWMVRLQAALALKQFDQKGMKFLSEQNREQSPEAYEITQYVISLP
ncbi:MAG: HEAT repeat domain-containing protein, partial [Chlamydiota bacterium]